MAGWEKWSYADPGDYVLWGQSVYVRLPLFRQRDEFASSFLTIPKKTMSLVVATFPKGTDAHPDARGAIILVPNRGLWWWCW